MKRGRPHWVYDEDDGVSTASSSLNSLPPFLLRHPLMNLLNRLVRFLGIGCVQIPSSLYYSWRIYICRSYEYSFGTVFCSNTERREIDWWFTYGSRVRTPSLLSSIFCSQISNSDHVGQCSCTSVAGFPTLRCDQGRDRYLFIDSALMCFDYTAQTIRALKRSPQKSTFPILPPTICCDWFWDVQPSSNLEGLIFLTSKRFSSETILSLCRFYSSLQNSQWKWKIFNFQEQLSDSISLFFRVILEK